MIRTFAYLIIVSFLVCACNFGKSQNTSQKNNKESVEVNNTSNALKPTKDSAVRRIKSIYHSIIQDYKKFERGGWPYLSFFDEELSNLWNQIPEGPGIGYDPWISGQDFDEDALELMNVEVGDIVEISPTKYITEVFITLRTIKDGEPNHISFILISTPLDETNYEWYITDIFQRDYPEDKGLKSDIKNCIASNGSNHDDLYKKELIDAMIRGMEEGKRNNPNLK